MAKNPEPTQSPKVSKLPLPVADSPLVIDLPDGQKIVIGKMTQGSVIEVATWRGVGRPDSRTSRLMLGVGNGNVEESPEQGAPASQAPAKPKKPQDWRIVLYYLAAAFDFIAALPWKKIVQSALGSVKKIKFGKKTPKAVKQSAPAEIPIPSVTTTPSSNASSVDDDIEAWLNKITEKASQKSAKLEKSSKSSTKSAAPQKKAVKKSAKPKAKRR